MFFFLDVTVQIGRHISDHSSCPPAVAVIVPLISSHTHTKKKTQNNQIHRDKSDVVSMALSPSHNPRQCCGDSEVHRGQTLASVPPSIVYTERDELCVSAALASVGSV